MSETARLPELTGEELDVLGAALLHYVATLDGDVHPSCLACQAARHLGVQACDAHAADVDVVHERVAVAQSLAVAVAEARYSLR